MHPIDCANASASPRPQWLVSVRSWTEAKLVASLGVDILDLKEPDHGSLAPVSVAIWRDVANWARQGDIPLSAALGEAKSARRLASHLPASFRWAKVGPSGNDLRSLENLWLALRRQLPPSVELVAVAYADHQLAQCPDPESVFQLAAHIGLKRVLIDTFAKNGPATPKLLGDRLVTLSHIAQEHDLWWSLAGSISLAQVRVLAPQATPDCFAIRGDVCEGGRTGSLSGVKLQRWATWIEATRQ